MEKLNGTDCITRAFSHANLTETETKVAAFLFQELRSTDDTRIKSVAGRCYTSPTTVTRTIRKLGYSGYKEMLYALKQSFLANQHSELYSDNLNSTFSYSKESLAELYRMLDRRGQIGVLGKGYSSLISRYIEQKLIGRGFLAVEQGYLESDQFVGNLPAHDSCMILISKSGEHPVVVDDVRECNKRGIPVVIFTGKATSSAARGADHVFLIDDDNPLDTINYGPSSFTGYCILAFEKIFSDYCAIAQGRTQVGRSL